MSDLVTRLRGYAKDKEHPIDVLVREAADEIERLNAALTWEQNRSERIGTHHPDCHTWGPQHYECLLRKLNQLNRMESEHCADLAQELAECKTDALRYRWLRDKTQYANWHAPCVVLGTPDGESFPFLCEEQLDAALDAAMQEAKP